MKDNKITVFYDHIRNACEQSGENFETIAQKLTRAGIAGVEIEFDELLGEQGELLAKTLSDNGLPVSSVFCHFRFEWETPAKDMIQVLSHLKKLGIHYLLVIPGFKKENESSRVSADALIPYVKKLCEEAPKYDVHVMMEDFDSTAASFGTGEELKYYMDCVPELGCAFDTGNFFYFDEDAREALEALIDRVTYVHCKDRSTTVVPEENGNETVGHIPMYAAAVGSGVIPMTEMLTKILATGYEGPLAIEHFGSVKQLADMLSSAEYLKGLLHE